MKVLAISAHPDDETLGCGGTLLKHGAMRDALYWVTATQAHGPHWSEELVRRKGAEVNRVAEAYGMQNHFQLPFPTVRLDTVPQIDLIDRIREIIQEVKPEQVFLVHDGDVHTDHHAVFVAALSVLKSFYMRKWGVRRILCYETLSSTEAAPPQSFRQFVPNVFHDITSFLERKIEIMGLFETEAQQDPLPRGPSAIRALARYRGATVGVEYAEAFMLIREVD